MQINGDQVNDEFSFSPADLQFVQQGHPEVVLERLQKAIQHTPDSGELYHGHFNVAHIYASMGRYELALHHATTALIKSSPAVQHQIHQSVCEFGLRAISNWRTARKFGQEHMPHVAVTLNSCKTIHIEEPTWETHRNLGILLSFIGSIDEAVEHYKRGIALCDDAHGKTNLYVNLAATLVQEGKPEPALEFARLAYEATGEAAALASVGFIINTARQFSLEGITYRNQAMERMFSKEVVASPIMCPSGKWTLQVGWTKGMSAREATVLNPTTKGSVWKNSNAVVFAKEPIPLMEEYEEKTLYLIKLKNIYFFGPAGVCANDCKVYTTARRAVSELPTSVSFFSNVATATPLHSPIISLVSHNTGNYYHWTLETLARLTLTLDLLKGDQSEGLPVTRLRSIGQAGSYKLLLARNSEAKQIEVLRRLGVPMDKVLLYDPFAVYNIQQFYQVEWDSPQYDLPMDQLQAELQAEPGLLSVGVVESTPESTPGASRSMPRANRSFAYDAWSVWYVPKKLVERTRKTLLLAFGFDPHTTAREVIGQGQWRVVYLSRNEKEPSNGKHGIRTIPNEEFLVERLKHIFGDRFLVAKCSEMSVEEQITLFQKTVLLVSPHGAGMSNMLYMPRNASVVMFPMRPHVDSTFNYLGAALGVQKTIVSEIAANYYYSYDPLTPDTVALAADATVAAALRLGIPEQQLLLSTEDDIACADRDTTPNTV